MSDDLGYLDNGASYIGSAIEGDSNKSKEDIKEEEKEQDIEGLNVAELTALDVPASAFADTRILIETLYIYDDTISALLVVLDLKEIQLVDQYIEPPAESEDLA